MDRPTRLQRGEEGSIGSWLAIHPELACGLAVRGGGAARATEQGRYARSTRADRYARGGWFFPSWENTKWI